MVPTTGRWPYHWTQVGEGEGGRGWLPVEMMVTLGCGAQCRKVASLLNSGGGGGGGGGRG